MITFSEGRFEMDVESIDNNGYLNSEFIDAGDDTASIAEIESCGERLLSVGCYPTTAWLDQEMCAAIWPLIKRFAETGTLREIIDE